LTCRGSLIQGDLGNLSGPSQEEEKGSRGGSQKEDQYGGAKKTEKERGAANKKLSRRGGSFAKRRKWTRNKARGVRVIELASQKKNQGRGFDRSLKKKPSSPEKRKKKKPSCTKGTLLPKSKEKAA